MGTEAAIDEPRVTRPDCERQSKDLMKWIEKLNCCGKLAESQKGK